MPLDEKVRNSIDAYFKRDLPGELQWHIEQFSFVLDDEFKSTRSCILFCKIYIGKLMEALLASGDEIHPFVELQTHAICINL